MFLTRKHIIDRLHNEDLVIDPIWEESQLGPFTIDLRLGTDFVVLPPKVPLINDYRISVSPYNFINAKIGEQLLINKHSGLLSTTLEFIKLPFNISAMILPGSALERLGLVIISKIIDQGYQGKISIPIHNTTNEPIPIFPGSRIFRMALVETSETVLTEKRKIELNIEITKLQNLFLERAKSLKEITPPTISLKDLYSNSKKVFGAEKGKALEKLVLEIIRTIKGLKIIKINARLKAEELDIVIQNNLNFGFWRIAGSPIIIECKNWSKRVGAREISILYDKLQSIGPDAKTGILIAPNGISGDSYKNAILKIREKRQQGRYIIVMDVKDLKEIANGEHAASIIERKYAEILLI